MTTLLTESLPLVAGTPNGIKKLRELILELAVRGKLVPQDPSDEPACDLLKRIAEEKARLLAEGKIKKQKALSERDSEDPAFKLPPGWAWARLADIVNVLNGRAYKKEELLDTGTPVLRVGNLFTSNHWYYSTLTLEEDKYCNPGDLLFAWSASFGPFIWSGERSIYHYHIWKLDFYAKDQLNKHYLYNYLLEQTQEIKAAGHGVSMIHMTKEKMEKLVVPVPPLPEQDRIVAKVDELMALCGRLEVQQTDSENAHAQLVQTLLDSLSQANDAIEFAVNWKRLAEHFHTLFTTEPSIDALKQTLLQLAVMGKLVQQDPDDESASEFVKRIQVEKQSYLARSNARKQKDLAENLKPEPPYVVPSGWEWQTIDDVLHVTGGVTLGRKLGDRKLVSMPYLRVANVQRGRLDMEQIKEIEVPEDEVEKYLLQKGDLLITEGGDWDKVGRTAIWRDELPECAHQNHVFRARAVVADWEPRWAEMYLNSSSARMYFAGSSKQTTNLASINMTQLRTCAFPLPPLEEQQRIITKVDQLMALCDRLKARLIQTCQLNEELASTLVERSLAEDAHQCIVATNRQSARTLLAAEITHQLHSQRTFGQRKLQKVIYLAEHSAKLPAIQGEYLRDAAGPHDRRLMNTVECEMRNHQWYERIEREAVGHAYRPLPQAGQHRQAYTSAWSATERTTIETVIELMRDWNTDRCEMTVTLYAAWNDFVLEGRSVTDESIVNEVMHSWNDTKLRFGKAEWLSVLADMKKHKILIPTGFGKRTRGGMLSLPGFE